MTQLIPINRVHITYKPSTAAFTNTKYFGCGVGVARELHDLTSRGHFVPELEDTDLELNLKGYSKGIRTLTILDTGGPADTFTLNLFDDHGIPKSYTVNQTGTDTAETLLLALEEALDLEPNPVVTASYEDDTLTLIPINYKKHNAVLSAATANATTSGGTTPDMLLSASLLDSGEIISPSGYPSIGANSVIDPSTIKVISKNTKFFSTVAVNSPTETSFRLLPVKTNAVILAKRNKTAAKTFPGTTQTCGAGDATLNLVFDLAANDIIEPGSVKLACTDGTNTFYINDFPVNHSGETLNTALEGNLYVNSDVSALTNIAGVALNNSTVNYISGDIHIDVTLNVSGAVVLNIASQCYTMVQVTSTTIGNSILKDLSGNDFIGMGNLVPNNNKEEVLPADFSGTFPGVGPFTATLGSDPAAADVNYVDSGTFVTFYREGQKYTEYKTGGTFDGTSGFIDTAASSFSNTNGNVSITFLQDVEAVYLTASLATYNLSTHETFTYDTERPSLIDRQVYDTELFPTKFTRNETGVTFGKVRSIGPCKYGDTLLQDAIFLTSPIFKTNSGAINYQSASEFVTVVNEKNYYRTLLDNSAGGTTPADPIYIEEAIADSLGELTFSEVGGEYNIRVKTAIRPNESTPEVIKPIITQSNYISGDIFLEYEAEIRDATVINKPLLLDPKHVERTYAKIGKPDPRNTLGFAVHMTNRMAPTAEFYVMAVESTSTGLAEGLAALSFYRDMLHIAVFTDEYDGTLDAWIDPSNPDGENHPDQSRFRFGYIPHELVETWDKIGSDAAFQTVPAGVLTTGGNSSEGCYYETSDVDTNFIEEQIAAGDYFSFNHTVNGLVRYTVAEVFEQEIVFQEKQEASVVNQPLTEIRVYRELTPAEIALRMYDIQSSDNSYLVKTLMEECNYTFDHAQTGKETITTIGREFGPAFPLAMKISSPPHQPLTYVEFSGFGFSDVAKSNGFFSLNDFGRLVSAGYMTFTSSMGGAPYIMRDVTCGIKPAGIEIQGILSKLNPVVNYAKDIWYATRPFIGRYNVTGDVTQAIGLKLMALREYYVTTNYKYLGTLLQTASQAKLTAVPNGLKIEYTVKPQDVLVEINNYITVVDA